MKKLNRKGFTLVELLAVIIILAIVVGITIPAVLNTISGAKQKAFTTAAETAADWIERQYQLYTIDPSDPGLNTTLSGKFSSTSFTISVSESEAAVIEAAGLKTTNVSGIKVKINAAGRVCALLTAASGGDYASQGKVTAAGATSTSATNYAKGGACQGVTFS